MKARETMKFKTSAGNHGHSEQNAKNQELATRVGELQIGGERGKVGTIYKRRETKKLVKNAKKTLNKRQVRKAMNTMTNMDN